MKKHSCLCCLVILLFASWIGANEALNIVYFDSYPPFSWQDENEQMKGILIDVLNEAIQTRMGIPISHSGYPWARAQKMVLEGMADGFVTVPTPERKEYIKASKEPVVVLEVTLFTQKGHPKMEELKKIHTFADLQGFTLLDYIGDGWGEKRFAGFEVDLCPKVENVFLKLQRGRGDLFVQNSQMSHHVIKQLGLQEEIVEIPNVLETSTFHLCIGQHSAFVDILDEFDKTIEAMRADGTLQTIYNAYK